MVSRRAIRQPISPSSGYAGRSNRVVPSLTVENYVKTIALIAARNPTGGPVGTGELAQALNVSPGTVTGMLKTLSEANLATYTPYEGARLTDSGQRLAMKVIRRHRLLERFLAETLTMSWDEVHEEAEHMEHAASERLIDRIDAYLGYPAVDPHGDPIPRADGSLAETEGVPLARCQPGQQFRVVRVMDQDPAFLRYLSECGLELNAEGELLENRPEAGASRLQAGRTERRAGTGRRREGAGHRQPPGRLFIARGQEDARELSDASHRGGSSSFRSRPFGRSCAGQRRSARLAHRRRPARSFRRGDRIRLPRRPGSARARPRRFPRWAGPDTGPRPGAAMAAIHGRHDGKPASPPSNRPPGAFHPRSDRRRSPVR